MEPIFFYFGKVILFSGVLFLYYQLFLKDKTFHHYNRFFLLATLLVSLLLPLVKIDYFTISVNKDMYLILNKLQNINPSKNTTNDYFYFKLAFAILGMVSLVFSLKLVLGILKIQKFKKEFPKENYEGINFYQTDLIDAPFSYFKNLFWKNTIFLNSDLGRQILKHEMVHVEQKHSLDKLFVEILKSIFWFNPVFWLIKKEINLIHEYLADKKAIKQNDTKAFAQMLLAGKFSGKPLPATSPFLNSNLKKRLKMLQKSKTKYSYARKIFALPLLFIMVFAYLVNAKNKEITKNNKEISMMFSKIKTDTLGIDERIAEQHRKIETAQKLVDEQSQKINDASLEINKKSEELNQIAKTKGTNSKEYEAKSAEIDKLSEKIDALAEEHSGKLVSTLDQLYSNLDKLYAEKDNQANFELPPIPEIPPINMEDVKMNPKEMKKIIRDAQKQAKKATQMVNSKEFKKQIEDAQKQALIAQNYINSDEFKNQMLEAKKAMMDAQKAQMYAQIETQKAQMEAQKAMMEAGNFELNAKFGDDGIPNKNFNVGFPQQTKIYIDGKPSTKAELDKLDPNKISAMYINKNKNGDKEESEIRIETKK